MAATSVEKTATLPASARMLKAVVVVVVVVEEVVVASAVVLEAVVAVAAVAEMVLNQEVSGDFIMLTAINS